MFMSPDFLSRLHLLADIRCGFGGAGAAVPTSTRLSFKVDIVDAEGVTVADVEKTLYIRRKQR